MKISLSDIKEILNRAKNGGGGNYTPLEVELAKTAYRYRCKIGEMGETVNGLRNELFSIYSHVNDTRSAGELMHRRAADLANRSKVHFAEAVRLDSKLKEMTNDEK